MKNCNVKIIDVFRKKYLRLTISFQSIGRRGGGGGTRLSALLFFFLARNAANTLISNTCIGSRRKEKKEEWKKFAPVIFDFSFFKTSEAVEAKIEADDVSVDAAGNS